MSEQSLAEEVIVENIGETGEGETSPELNQNEQEASKWGWAKQEKWRGAPEDWVDADAFVEKFVPAIKANRQTYNEFREELAQTKKIAKESMEILRKAHEESLKTKDAEYGSALKTLKSQLREAARNGEDDDADRIEGEIEALNTERSKLKEAPKPQVNPESNKDLQEWTGENKWFTDDPDLREYALDLAEKWNKAGTNPGGKVLLEKLGEKVRTMFPHKFEEKRRPSAVEGTGKTSGSKSSKTANDLPPEHRSMMREMVKAGYITEQAYLSNYSWN